MEEVQGARPNKIKVQKRLKPDYSRIFFSFPLLFISSFRRSAPEF